LLLSRLQKLNEKQIDKLIAFLDLLESDSPSFTIPLPVPEEKKVVAKKDTIPVIENKVMQKVKEKNPYEQKTELVFRILSTWGHPHVVGLTELELYDVQGKRIIAPLQARNLGTGLTQPILRLTNGRIYVNDEKAMWIAHLPPSPKVLELVFTLPANFNGVGGLIVWNYNKNSLDSVKGVKEAEVMLNGKIIWKGTIKRGNGQVNEDYSTEIVLGNSPNVFKEKPQALNEIPKELLKIKEDIERNSSRPMSIPTWLQGEDLNQKKAEPELPKVKRHTLQQEPLKSEVRKSTLQRNELLPERFNKVSSRRKIGKPTDQRLKDTIEKDIDNIEVPKPQRLVPDYPKDPLDILIEEQDKKKRAPNKVTFEYIKSLYKNSSNFIIPKEPKGQILTFDLLSTWDDPHYIGLAGIEVFTIEGLPISIHSSRIKAEPSNINILPEYVNDPRTVDKLVDGTYFTRDDTHVWLAPYTPNKRHYITIDLGVSTCLSMIRIWNYNKSRIHSERGVKNLVITLDQSLIFIGEIKKAPGTLNDLLQCCEVILFTNNINTMEQIEVHDWIGNVEVEERSIESFVEERPHTATKVYTKEEIIELQRKIKEPVERPLTSALTSEQVSVQEKLKQQDKELAKLQLEEGKVQVKQTMAYGSSIKINILETWGDMFYAGLTGIEVYNYKGIKITPLELNANPKDLSSIPGYSGDYRTLDKLIDGVNNTTDDRHMWMIPFNKLEQHWISITLPKAQYISALTFYNYNKSIEDTSRGIKRITILVDGKLVTPKNGLIVCRAPGNTNSDFGHSIKIPFVRGWDNNKIAAYKKNLTLPLSIPQDYITPHLPTGFIFTVILYSNYGDVHYIGLSGLEMYDLLGNPMLQNRNYLIPYDLSAVPSSVNEIPELKNDIRTLDKLIDGFNNTLDDRHMWLAPFKNTKLYAVTNREVAKTPNIITIKFEEQVALGGIRFWNYGKTEERRVQEIGIFCDGALIYRVHYLCNIGNTKTNYGPSNIYSIRQ